MGQPSRSPAVDSEQLRALLSEALRRLATADEAERILATALAEAGGRYDADAPDAFCAFAGGPVYDAVTQVLDRHAADAMLDFLGPIIERWVLAGGSGVRRSRRATLPSSERCAVVAASDEPLRARLVGALERAGYQVEVTTDGVAALAAATRLVPRIVVVQEDLERIDGTRLAKLIRIGLGPSASPVVVIGTDGAPTVLASGLSATEAEELDAMAASLADGGPLRAARDHERKASGVRGKSPFASGEIAPAVAPVLIVDDDPLMRTTLARVIGQGWPVLTAPDASVALGLCVRHRPRLVVTDFEMPGINGADLARLIGKALGDQAPAVVIVTGRDPSQVHCAEAKRVLQKTLTPDELLRELAPWLGAAEKG